MGYEFENEDDADVAIRTRKSLSEILRKYPQLRQAWDRGQFLRDLKRLARSGFSVSDAAKNLGFANGQVLRTMIDEDMEVGNLWNQANLEVRIEIKSALIEAAKEGKADAVRAVESFLQGEKERPGFDHSRITILQLTEITGKTRQTIHEWYTKFGLPRNADKTFDLGIFLAWHEEFVLKKASAGKKSIAVLDPLKTAKAEMIRLELDKKRKVLLDRQEVVCTEIFWVQNLKTHCSRGAEELAGLCQNQSREKIKELMDTWFKDLFLSMTKVPVHLSFPPAMGRELESFLKRLKPHDYSGAEIQPPDLSA